MKRAISLILVLAMVLAMPVLAMAEEDNFGVGSAEGNSYWNDSLSIGCTLDDEWYFYTDEEIMKSIQTTTWQLKGDLAKMVKDAGSMMDMKALNTETGENVNITLERLSLINSLLISEKTYVEITKQQLSDALEQIGMELIIMEPDEMEFMGQTHPCLRISGFLQDNYVHETQVMVKSGRTMIVVTAFSYWKNTTEEILSNFYSEKP